MEHSTSDCVLLLPPSFVNGSRFCLLLNSLDSIRQLNCLDFTARPFMTETKSHQFFQKATLHVNN